MKKVRKSFVAVVLVATILTPNIWASSSVGKYSNKTTALKVEQSYDIGENKYSRVAWPLAIAAGVGLAIVFAAGVVDGWNAAGARVMMASNNIDDWNYKKYDFGKFDN